MRRQLLLLVEDIIVTITKQWTQIIVKELLDLRLVVVRVRAETEEAHLTAQVRGADDVTVRRPFRFRVGYGAGNIDVLLNERGYESRRRDSPWGLRHSENV